MKRSIGRIKKAPIHPPPGLHPPARYTLMTPDFLRHSGHRSTLAAHTSQHTRWPHSRKHISARLKRHTTHVSPGANPAAEPPSSPTTTLDRRTSSSAAPETAAASAPASPTIPLPAPPPPPPPSPSRAPPPRGRSRNFRAALRVLAALTNRTTETHAPATKHAKESVRHARPKKPKPARWSSNERCVATNTSARPPLTPPNRRPLRAFRRRSSPAPSEGSNASPKPSSRSSAPASFPPFVPSFRGSLLRVPGGPGGALVTSPTTVSSVPRGRTRSLRLVPRILNPALASARCARTFPAELRPASASAGAKWSCATVRTQSFAAAASE